MSDHSENKLLDHYRRTGWMPPSDEALEEWVGGMAAKVTHPTHRDSFPVLPEIQDLKKFIESDAQVYIGFNQMFKEKASPLSKHIPHYDRVLEILNKIVQEAPAYGGIGAPVFMLLSHAMNTQGGFNTLLNKELNDHFKRLFNQWAIFLSSPASCYVFSADEGGWFSKPALGALVESFDGLQFKDIFVCDPTAQHHGFTSWDDFFNRRLRPGVRPIEFAENPDIIGAACESQFYNLAKDVKARDTFWLKGEPYSLLDMLYHDELAEKFIGGTVVQGFLQVTGYHRWHAPATGVVKKIVAVPGTYFVQSPATLHAPDKTNPYLHSLAFLTAMSAHAHLH
ncbi:Phophatidylserine decarboxylase-domain-containing protein [Mycena epipterygia]|nr:Phophatidylserine decarboxylase-domain-containing protein [Mycena epipterygia]